MNRRSHLSAANLAALGMLLSLGACAVTGVGVGYDDGPGYEGGFYEPYGYDYGYWGGGYRVGPPRGDYRGGGPGRGFDRGGGPEHGGGNGGRPYRSAPGGHSMPSMPGRPRGH